MSASSTAAISIKRCPSECSDAAMSTAEERSTKRARIEIKPFTELDISEFTLKHKGKGKNGGHMAYLLLSGESIRFNLTPNEWLRTPFGFDGCGVELTTEDTESTEVENEFFHGFIPLSCWR